MVHYRIRFIKNICDDSGHPHKCVEGVVDIHQARDESRAIEAAKRRFERMKKIQRWDMYADTFELDTDQRVRS
jgi:hypothetical protein